MQEDGLAADQVAAGSWPASRRTVSRSTRAAALFSPRDVPAARRSTAIAHRRSGLPRSKGS